MNTSIGLRKSQSTVKHDAIIFVTTRSEGSVDAVAYELNFRERHGWWIEAQNPEPTIYRRCRDAGYSMDSFVEFAADRNVTLTRAHELIAKRAKREPLTFLEA